MKMNYDIKKGAKRRLWRGLSKQFGLIIVALIIVVAGVVALFNNQLQPVSKLQTDQTFIVKTGSTIKSVANDLAKQHLIRNALAMEIYAYNTKVQAGTYSLSPSLGTVQIVKIMTKGRVATSLVTILPGRRIDQVRADLINSGFSPASVDAALITDQYKDLPVMAYVPAGVTALEGLLWPDSYQKSADTDPAIIIREALTATGDHLTTDVRATLAAEGLTPYQGLILASIIVQEVGKPADQAQAAQVFLTRLKTGMMLGSDVTANYGAVIVGLPASLTYDSPYNTLIHSGLPPTPISTVNASSLQAVTHPAATNWLYFVAGDNGTTYFSTNLQDHQALTAQYCHKLCGQ